MDLWIRSQRKERLCKTSNFVIREANKQGYYAIAENRNKNTIEYGIYKTKERALEVLDEIQKLLMPQVEAIYNNKIEVVKLQDFTSDIIVKPIIDDIQIKQLNNYVYEMPKE